MKRFAVALITTSVLITAVSVGFGKDLSTVGLEEGSSTRSESAVRRATSRVHSARAPIRR